MRDLIRKWYRVQLYLDDLPVLMRQKGLKYYAAADIHSDSLLRLAALASRWTSYISTITFASLLHTKKILALSKAFVSLDLMSTPFPSKINMMAKKLSHQAPRCRHATNPGLGVLLPKTSLNRTFPCVLDLPGNPSRSCTPTKSSGLHLICHGRTGGIFACLDYRLVTFTTMSC
jgi:hypothetical protein